MLTHLIEYPGRTAMLNATNLSLANGRTVSFSATAGRPLAVAGISGSGKTLLLRSLADLDPARGTVNLDGVSRDAVSAPDWRARVAYVPAEPGWWAPTLRDHLPDSSSDGLAALGLAEALLDAPIDRLSTGERQRAALLRAMTRRPRALLLDEPTGPLDPATTTAVEAVLRDWPGILVLVSHDPGQPDRLGAERLSL
ncbi:ATP-binding cassette domain-containing protein [Aestuariibius sp. 2305UL40-4]|uniref:ABC transporter ATP-binding protein n=1 Tax=Aestuariibius violaceus TaxID=3234132 RepID=UPI00345EE87F